MRTQIASYALVYALSAQVAFGQNALYSVTGTQVEDALGAAVAAIGDLDGDGRRDLLVSRAPAAVEIRSGSSGVLLHTLQGTPGFGFGTVLAAIGDVDLDGREEFAIGEPLANSSGTAAGRIYVYSGATAQLMQVIPGLHAKGYFGSAIAACHDLDLDGYPDLRVGAPGAGVGGVLAGMVVFWSVHKNALISAIGISGAGLEFGARVIRLGDYNGDGIDEYAVSAPKTTYGPDTYNTVRVFDGKFPIVHASYAGNADQPALGITLANVGDINGDGTCDFALGDPGAKSAGTESGVVRVYSGSTLQQLLVINGQAGSRLGASIAAAGDLDGDGNHEFLVGAPGNPGLTQVPGRVLAYDGSGATILTYSASAPGSGFGMAVAGLGNVNGDPHADVAIGEPMFNGANPEVGRVTVSEGLVECGSIAFYGTGCSGQGGVVPVLSLQGCARYWVPGSLNLSIQKGPGKVTTGLLLFGLGQSNLPVFGTCKLLVSPLLGPVMPLIIVPSSPTPGSGSLFLSSSVPPAGAAYSVTMQAFVQDTAAAGGWSSTNAVELTVAP